MSEMSLVLSEKFTAEDAASIRAELGRRLQVGKPVSLRQRSIDPPSVIQLLGEAAAWLPLVALLHEYPLRVGQRGPHFSGPSAGATLRG